MNRRPAPGPDPSLGAWCVVVGAFLVALGEVASSAVRIAFFPLVQDRWRRRIAARITAGALPCEPGPAAGDGASPSPKNDGADGDGAAED